MGQYVKKREKRETVSYFRSFLAFFGPYGAVCQRARMGPYEARGVKNGPFPAFVDTRGSENRDLAHLGCFGASEVQVGSGGKGNGERVRGPEAQGPRGPVEGLDPLGKLGPTSRHGH